MESMSEMSEAVDRAHDCASDARPEVPSDCTIAHAAASGPADFDPSIVGFTTG